VLHYSELLALALGVDPEELALRSHKVKTDKVIERI
jgi:heterodisulfide reductase subunit B